MFQITVVVWLFITTHPLSNIGSMHKKENLKMENIFSSDDKAQDMMDCSERLQALGRVISSLSFSLKEHGDQTLVIFGQAIGDIIFDYAEAVHSRICSAYCVLRDFFEENDNSLLYELSEELRVLQHMKKGASSQATIADALEKIDAEIVAADKFVELKRRYLKLQKGLDVPTSTNQAA